MSLSVKKLGDIRRSTFVEFESDGGPIRIEFTYRLSAMNIQLSDWLDEHTDDRGSLMGWLERLLSRWDIVDDDGRQIPITAEAMEQYAIATPILRLILNKCYQDGAASNLSLSSATTTLVSAIAQNGIK